MPTLFCYVVYLIGLQCCEMLSRTVNSENSTKSLGYSKLLLVSLFSDTLTIERYKHNFSSV